MKLKKLGAFYSPFKAALPVSAAFCLFAGVSSTDAATVFLYDSDGDANHLSEITSETDAAFVTSASTLTSVGAETITMGLHPSQTNTTSLGGGNDLNFRFGAGAVSKTVGDSLTAGRWIGFSFVAAQDLAIDEIFFDLQVKGTSDNLIVVICL